MRTRTLTAAAAVALLLAGAVVEDPDGHEIDAPAEGYTVEVWIGDGCAESSPVQCEIVALRVQG